MEQRGVAGLGGVVDQFSLNFPILVTTSASWTMEDGEEEEK